MELTVFERMHTHGQQAHENILNIINHQENENENHNEIIISLLLKGCYQKRQE